MHKKCHMWPKSESEGKLDYLKPVKSRIPHGTILKLLLFLVCVNELTRLLELLTLLFADNVKSQRTTSSEVVHLDFQLELDKLVKWSHSWGLDTNSKAGVTTHIGHDNIYQCTIDGTSLSWVQEHKDLRVIVSRCMKTTTHCNAAVVKCFRTSWLRRQACKWFDDMFRVLYITYVRPHLEYYIQAVGPSLIKDTKALECVQSVGTKLMKVLCKLFYDERLKRLNLFPYSCRRTQGNFILAFYIFNYDLIVNISRRFVSSSTNNLRGYSKKIQKPLSVKVRAGFRFSHRVVNDWNTLSEQLGSDPFVNILKEKLDLHWKKQAIRINKGSPIYYSYYWISNVNDDLLTRWLINISYFTFVRYNFMLLCLQKRNLITKLSCQFVFRL